MRCPRPSARKINVMHAHLTEIAIIRADAGWSLVSGERTLGRFDYRVDAEEAALRLAQEARLEHRRIRLLAPDDHGRLRPFAD